jgi:multiple antibiotic resistance protein
MDSLMAILYSAVSLFIILDPLLSIPLFMDLTRRMKPKDIARQAAIAIAVAGGLMYFFLFFNLAIFSVLSIDIASFQIAGGILLFFLGMQEAMGFHLKERNSHSKTAAGVVIGTPLLCGPGTITNVMLLSKTYGIIIPSIAIAISLVATWLVLRYSTHIQKALGKVVTEILGKLLGMLLAAIAIRIIANGIVAII